MYLILLFNTLVTLLIHSFQQHLIFSIRISSSFFTPLPHHSFWWRWTGSNRWPLACKASALPAELHPLLLKWWAWEDSNFRPHAYQACALTTWATSPSRCVSFRYFKIDAWTAIRSFLLQSSLTVLFFLWKEVIQPHLPIRLPCYDFTPVTDPTVATCPLAVSTASSGRTNSHGVTGGVYKARERIHRDLLIRDY